MNMSSLQSPALKVPNIRAALVEWHGMICGSSARPQAADNDELCFINTQISPKLGKGSLDLISFDDDFILLGMRGYFHEALMYQAAGEGWTRLHFRKAARTLMEFDGNAPSDLEGPLCQILHHPVGVRDREWIEGGASLDWVTVLVRPGLLVERFKLDSIRLTDPVRRLAYGADEFLLENWSLSAEMMLAMDQLLGNAYCGDMRRVHLEAKATELVCMMSRVLTDRTDEASAIKLHPRDIEALHEVRRILARSLTERPSIESLSRRVGINRNKLTFGFRHLFDQTISDFCIETRLQAAWTLLQETSLPVAVVAERVGYAQATAFSTAFRQHFGVPPRQARRR